MKGGPRSDSGAVPVARAGPDHTRAGARRAGWAVPCAKLKTQRYPARNAVARGLGWLKGWRRVAARYDQYVHHFLGFLYLVETWIWMKSNIHTT